ncbi:hypothetical protein [Malonomonas rubra]|uniref:hypothetical protein n=1 Tax=Malonomonas rubra TaxID=57040 RepID=UPI0026F15F08|nr:hypothetical protein [Malonomonas rubra]
MLISQPEADRDRLELTRSQFSIGDLEAARSQFNQVLANHPPAMVHIKSSLELISTAAQRHIWSGSVSLGLSYDDDVYASPLDEQIDAHPTRDNHSAWRWRHAER